MKKNVVHIIIFFVLLGNHLFGQAWNSQYSLKAAFLYHFTIFIEWEDNGENIFQIAVLGKCPITKQLLGIAEEKKINGKTIIVKEYNDLNEINFCHILFIPMNSPVKLNEALSKFGNASTLIVTEQEGYAEKGSHLNFFISEENKLKFEANLETIKKSKLRVSSNLLKIAVLVGY